MFDANYVYALCIQIGFWWDQLVRSIDPIHIPLDLVIALQAPSEPISEDELLAHFDERKSAQGRSESVS